tara:strand:+ start:1171 stop:1557 length:387 start_codon:yes stop_codon:yes gene_type:complete
MINKLYIKIFKIFNKIYIYIYIYIMKYYIEYIQKNITKKHIYIGTGIFTLLGGLGTIGYLAKKGYLPSFNIQLEKNDENNNDENHIEEEKEEEENINESNKLNSFIKNYRENEELMDQEIVINNSEKI